jgi:hypothetical protein
MLIKIYVATVLIAAVPLWSQANTEVPEPAGDAVTDSHSRMLTPPSVSGEFYPRQGTAETQSNYLRGGVSFTSAYSDNVISSVPGQPISDASYSIRPMLALEKTTSRSNSELTYSPGFTFYQRLSSLNQADQNFAADIQFRLSPHVTVSLLDSFQKTSNAFDQSGLAPTNRISGSPEPPTVAVIVPAADRLTNTGNVGITYQFGLNSMVGATGSFSNLHYPNLSQVPGLFDSSSQGGSVFYSHRVLRKHYIGAGYRYQRTLSYPVGADSEVQGHTAFLFYTIYLKPTFSLSLTGGPQYSDKTQSSSPAFRTWSPAIAASIGWQGRHTSLAGSYSRMVTAGGGLVGVFQSNNASVSGIWQFTRSWSAGLSGNYSIYKNLDLLDSFSSPGGHTLSGTASMQHQLGQHLSIQAGYTRLHQDYRGIAAISASPDANREFVSISYQFARPLGR